MGMEAATNEVVNGVENGDAQAAILTNGEPIVEEEDDLPDEALPIDDEIKIERPVSTPPTTASKGFGLFNLLRGRAAQNKEPKLVDDQDDHSEEANGEKEKVGTEK